MQTEINNQWIYEQSPSEVWEYLTQPELVSLWLMPNDIKPVVGHEFQFRTKPIPSLDLDGIMHCKVLEVEPHRKLIYSWKAGPGNGIITLDTICEWTLVPHGNGTKLLLTQSGFKESNFDIFTGMTEGWQKHVLTMRDLIEAKNKQLSK